MSPRVRLALGAAGALLSLLTVLGVVVTGDGEPLDVVVVVCGASALSTGCGIASVAAREVRDEK